MPEPTPEPTLGLTLADDEVDAYLARIGAGRPASRDRASLAELHRRHVLSVPFENLDIVAGRRNVIDLATNVDKVIRRKRGGWCFELNSLFAALLDSFGFEVELLAARVARPGDSFGRQFEHLALRVHVDDEPVPMLADVGFGEAFREPVALVADLVQPDADHRVRLVGGGDGWLYEDDRDGRWKVRYTFDATPRMLSDFESACEWLQSSPESHFTQQSICSLATDRGRITIADDRLIERVDGVRSEQTVTDPTEVLRRRFGIDLHHSTTDSTTD